MSGWVAVFNGQNPNELNDMLRSIRHRGPAFHGTRRLASAGLGQNYAAGDIGGAPPAGDIPVVEPSSGMTVCFDGQIGNLEALCGRFGVPDGPLREERLVLEMFLRHGDKAAELLDDAIFALLVSDGVRFWAARDVLGIKTLFYGRKNGGLYFGSELKSVAAVADTLHEFPAGQMMDESGRLRTFAELPAAPPEVLQSDPVEAAAAVRDIVTRSVASRVAFQAPTGSLLSGGVDSSVVAALASRAYRERFGTDAKLPTFALGVGESEDIRNARQVAAHIGSEHHELIVDLEQMLAVLPEVIYHLESFDPSLVRSAVANFLVSGFARQKGIDVLLSGEGGDEVFCGYTHLKATPRSELFARQVECLGLLHNNASLRLDRMNQCHSVRVVAPLISGELLNYALGLDPELKIKTGTEPPIEKWVFRKAFEDLLPPPVAWRIKKEFSQGSGSADVLPAHFESTVSDEALQACQRSHPQVRSKEELTYFELFVERFGAGSAVDTVGQWVAL